ncbi:hypothetical protein MAM1_0026d02147 [Mucor ambiguus]|uniref:Uncharacterized protein n=1 Tax=Mucor ambiguus TaxID=91626 RepID=A0A0C9M240_9FUNG|nr:hypothetical protein MAM1_0026d02147 [Mucor ambiguus]
MLPPLCAKICMYILTLKIEAQGAQNRYRQLHYKGALGSLEHFSVHNVFAAFFEREFRASAIQSTVAIETTIKVLDHATILLDITANDSFKDKNEGDAVDSKANDNGTVNAVEATTVIISGHAEQEATDDVALPPTAKYSKIWKHNSTKQLLLSSTSLLTPSLNF